MGNVNTRWVPAAILYMNPGINKDEFVELLNEVRVGLPTNWNRDWQDCGPIKYEDSIFHKGVYEVGEILSLQKKKFTTGYNLTKDDINDMKDNLPGVCVIPNKSEEIWLPPKYKTIQEAAFAPTEYEEEKEITFYHEPELGDMLSCPDPEKPYSSKPYGRIGKILSLQQYSEENKQIYYKAKIVINVGSVEVFSENNYDSLDELIEEEPGLSPDECYDWSPENGDLRATWRDDLGGKWTRKGEQYYLDESYFFDVGEAYGNTEEEKAKFLKRRKKGLEKNFSDMVVTSEAIRQKAWNIFGFYGYAHTQRFLVEHPDSWRRHNHELAEYYWAVWARDNNKTIREFMEARRGKIPPKTPDLTDQQALNIVMQEARQHHGAISELHYGGAWRLFPKEADEAIPKPKTVEELIFGTEQQRMMLEMNHEDNLPF